MIMFSFVEADYKDSVFLPDGDIYLSFVYSASLDLHFLRMECYNQGSRYSRFARYQRYGLRPVLANYRALPYKRQSSITKSDERVTALKTNSFGFPWFDNCASLNKMRSFYSSCKRYYAVIAHRSVSADEDQESVLILFNRYSDAIFLSRDYEDRRIKSLLGSEFRSHYKSWYPHVCVEYMGHPISLFADIDSYVVGYPLASNWCHYFLFYVSDGLVSSGSSNSFHGFIQKDKFSQIIYWDS